ncbi:hypothetical protein DUI87_09465 [Hirundo rustica rustica]|uniref:Uncharacterized protein n=1 Tax=Hirundo rustica rustica TaxID=333673 RepID=A0A3M0KUC5_HIRRU|nr:hypothetical protein DUI87_09465 [Hirundo rustica rustica]
MSLLHALGPVQTWLGQELEKCGIDAMIYTRYVLSLLLHDSYDYDLQEQPGFVFAIASPWVECLGLGLVELHEIDTGPPLKPVQGPLDGIPSLQCASGTTHASLVSLADLLREHLIPLSVSLTKALNNISSSTDPEKHLSLAFTWTSSH